MPLPQLSVLVENKPGKMAEVMDFIDRSKIKVFALSIADAGECGLIRLIVDNPESASKILENEGFNLAKSRSNIEVIAVITTEKDTVSKVAKIIGESKINIEYAYTSTMPVDGKFALILRVSDTEKAERILREGGIIILSTSDLKSLTVE